ncbi:MAG: hypothetical protein GY940_13050, partial [bacterium]|nr:hypothetical protein [bacterium]
MNNNRISIKMLAMGLVFFMLPLLGSAQEEPLFTVNPGLFHSVYADNNPADNGLFDNVYQLEKDIMSNRLQARQTNAKPRLSAGKFFGEIFMGMVGNVAG